MAENLRFTVGKADEHIRDNAGSVKGDLRHVYHAMPPIGWMNDPNGFCYAADKYHLFFSFTRIPPRGDLCTGDILSAKI